MFMSVWDPKTLNLMDMVTRYGEAEPGSDVNGGRCSTEGVPIKMPHVMYFGKNADNPDQVEGVRHQGPVQFFCDGKPFMLVLDFQTYNNPGNKGSARVKLTNTSRCANATTFKVYWLTTQAKDEGYAQAYIAHYNIDNNKNEHGFSPLDQKFCPKGEGRSGSNGNEGSGNQTMEMERMTMKAVGSKKTGRKPASMGTAQRVRRVMITRRRTERRKIRTRITMMMRKQTRQKKSVIMMERGVQRQMNRPMRRRN
uniref:AlNc14C85G5479 protein n=1 Tax=Albugo laibachii Nc14 TaxID=890382 RepID=F0WFU4_9STRA|nr:AlNc14C85G5479 [Albugo laibachii Nc14]|eukprot:CCA20078.1 AlNc14C85G5479 [Albugo laibachii Nc14]